MLLIAALGVAQAYKSKAASQTDTQKNSSTSVRAQAMPEDLFLYQLQSNPLPERRLDRGVLPKRR